MVGHPARPPWPARHLTAVTLCTMSSWLPSGRVLPSSCISGTKEKPNSFFSPFSFAARGERKERLACLFKCLLTQPSQLCLETQVVKEHDYQSRNKNHLASSFDLDGTSCTEASLRPAPRACP